MFSHYSVPKINGLVFNGSFSLYFSNRVWGDTFKLDSKLSYLLDILFSKCKLSNNF